MPEPRKTGRITVKQAATISGMGEQYIRIGLQLGVLPFGSAVKLSSKWTYYISEQRLYDYIGIKPDNKEA